MHSHSVVVGLNNLFFLVSDTKCTNHGNVRDVIVHASDGIKVTTNGISITTSPHIGTV